MVIKRFWARGLEPEANEQNLQEHIIRQRELSERLWIPDPGRRVYCFWSPMLKVTLGPQCSHGLWPTGGPQNQLFS